MKNETKIGHLGFTLRENDQVIIAENCFVRINKISGSYVKVSVMAPVSVDVSRIIRKTSDDDTRVWRRKDD